MNQLMLLGNVGQDAETHQFENNRYAIRFSLAVTENWKDNNGVKQSRTDWFRCVRYTTSPNLADYIKKGTKLLVIGKASAEAYIKDGQAIANPVCNVRDIQFVDSAPNARQNEGSETKPNTSSTQILESDNDLPF
jgi:single-strand DNA-binding protein